MLSEVTIQIEQVETVVLLTVLGITVLYLVIQFLRRICKKKKSSVLYLILISLVAMFYEEILSMISEIITTFGTNPFGFFCGFVALCGFAVFAITSFEELKDMLDDY